MANTKIQSEQIEDDVALGGNPTTTTQSAGNNTTRVATTAFVTTAVANLVDSAPSALDTLNELAAAMGDDASFSTTITNSIATKLPLAGGTMTGDIAHASDFTIDAGGDITLDADGADIILKDGGTSFAELDKDNNNFRIKNPIADGDIKIQGVDGSSTITALDLDMSEAGKATFNAGGAFNDDVSVFGSDSKLFVGESGAGGTFGFLAWNDSSNYLYLGNSYNSAFNTDLVIDSSGNIGINYSTPKEKLHVVGAAVFDGNHATATNAFRADEGVLIHGAGNIGYITAVSNGNNDVDLRLRALNGGSANGDQLVLDSDGNVGIGDGAPSQKLNVAGNIMLEGNNQYLYLTNVGTGNSGIYVRGNTASSYLRSHSTGKFTWEVTGSQKMELDSTGALRINNTRTTSTNLHVVGGTASGTVYDTAVFAGGQNSTSGSGARIYLSGCENDPIARGVILQGESTDTSNTHALIIKTSAPSSSPSERIRIDHNGIKFNGDTAAANGLDDYEEGTLTFGNIAGHTNVTGTPTQEYALYTKVGNLIHIQARFSVNPTSTGKTAIHMTTPFAMHSGSNVGLLGLVTAYATATNNAAGYILDYTGGNDSQIYIETNVNDTAATGFTVQLTYRTS